MLLCNAGCLGSTTECCIERPSTRPSGLQMFFSVCNRTCVASLDSIFSVYRGKSGWSNNAARGKAYRSAGTSLRRVQVFVVRPHRADTRHAELLEIDAGRRYEPRDDGIRGFIRKRMLMPPAPPRAI